VANKYFRPDTVLGWNQVAPQPSQHAHRRVAVSWAAL